MSTFAVMNPQLFLTKYLDGHNNFEYTAARGESDAGAKYYKRPDSWTHRYHNSKDTDGRRKYYHITESGVSAYEKALKE